MHVCVYAQINTCGVYITYKYIYVYIYMCIYIYSRCACKMYTLYTHIPLSGMHGCMESVRDLESGMLEELARQLEVSGALARPAGAARPLRLPSKGFCGAMVFGGP